MAAKAPVTWASGDIGIETNTKRGAEVVKGLRSSSGLGVHKAIDRKGYVIIQIRSGKVVKYADTQAQAKLEAERVSHTVNWHKDVKPTRELRDKIIATAKGEKPPSNRKLNDYKIKANLQPSNITIKHAQARGYTNQQKERGTIRHELQGKGAKHHVRYKIDVMNTTKGRKIK